MLAKHLELDLGGGVKLKVVRIEPGTFLMGSPDNEVDRFDNELQHEVEITKPYYVGVYTVTQAQYRQVIGENPSWFSAEGKGKDKVASMNTDDFPVEMVSYKDAVEFCRRVSELPEVKSRGLVVDLPTEAEWEFACRAGTKTAFHFGNSLSSKDANFNGKYPYGGAAEGPYLGRTEKVGQYLPNAWGLYDMHGNVYQWCKDWYGKDYYQNSDKKDPQGPDNGSARVLRGGSWDDVARFCRAAYRFNVAPEVRTATTVFGWWCGCPPGLRNH